MSEQTTQEQIVEMDINLLRTFKDHPFKVTADYPMIQLKESIENCGILTPLLVRPLKDGSYEIISGHRRKHAVERFFIKDRDQKKKSDSKNRWMGSMMRVCCDLLHALFSLQTGL